MRSHVDFSTSARSRLTLLLLTCLGFGFEVWPQSAVNLQFERSPDRKMLKAPLVINTTADAKIRLLFVEVVYNASALTFQEIATQGTLAQSWLKASRHVAGQENVDTLRVALLRAKHWVGNGALLHFLFHPLADSLQENDVRVLAYQIDRDAKIIMPASVPDRAEETSSLPAQFALRQNHPNPFSYRSEHGTTIAFDLPLTTNVTIRVLNVLGQVVKVLVEGEVATGRHKVSWRGANQNGEPLASGVYLYEIRTPQFVQLRKMLLLR